MKQKFWREALASLLIVGLGQIIKGEGEKGLLLLLAFYFAIPLSIYTALTINAYLFVLLLAAGIITELVIWLYNIIDAFKHETDI
ncbi:hypothetical protein A2311_01135 [candidate division WOR-1 bacterium RIFOXYB2_FULL_48_7]|uniref:DUF5683 domain-containing protein n=1 Tax=candidate division WOR-1 bacterium RIFOXYB2_FULL_48_7 TaxID=1802583 RepID=A0A1F4TNN5_UNCSA|nr:MAG: hypothetical protein A2311_01135 [candidate division WOR-1 bacterium RIFOXYB2_FULL_48_7]